jgi:hypothetical protein
MFVECDKILELFAVANLSNFQGNELSPMVEMSVHISICLILIAECAHDPALLSGNRHDMTFSYSYDVNTLKTRRIIWCFSL